VFFLSKSSTVGTVFPFRKGPEAAIEKFFKNLNAGQAEAAQQLVAEPQMSPDRKRIGDQALAVLLRDSKDGDATMLGAACSAAVEKGGYVVDILNVDLAEDVAVVQASVNLRWPHPPWKTEFHLVRKNDQWIITDVPFTFVMTGMSMMLYGDFKTRVLIGLPANYPR